ncbi:hypothetical protein D3C85_396410 [compost metagenome]
MSNDKFVKIGQQMWLDMLDTFMTVGKLNEANTPEQMAAMWAGYLAAASGSGCAVFGKENMLVIMRTIMKSVEEHEVPKPDLRVVK